MNHRGTVLKYNDVILFLKDTLVFRDYYERITIPKGTKLKVDAINDTFYTHINFCGNRWRLINDYGSFLRCKDVAHSPTECKNCKLFCKV